MKENLTGGADVFIMDTSQFVKLMTLCANFIQAAYSLQVILNVRALPIFCLIFVYADFTSNLS